MSTTDPITMAREIECSNWLNLGNMPPEAWGRVNFTGIMGSDSEAMGQGNMCLRSCESALGKLSQLQLKLHLG